MLVSTNTERAEIEQMAINHCDIKKLIGNADKIKKIIFVPKKLVNIVI